MRLMRKYHAPAMILLCVLAACEGDDDARTATDAAPAQTATVSDSTTARLAPTGACALVEEAAVEQAVGFDVVMNGNSTGNCVLTPASGEPAAPAFDFRVEPRVTAFDYFSAQPDATAIPGVGDRAVWATVNEMTGYVVIVDGGRAIVAAVAKADGLEPVSRRQTEALARVVLAAAMTEG